MDAGFLAERAKLRREFTQKNGFLVTVRNGDMRQCLGMADVEVTGVIFEHGANGAISFKIAEPCEIIFSSYPRTEKTSLWKRITTRIRRPWILRRWNRSVVKALHAERMSSSVTSETGREP